MNLFSTGPFSTDPALHTVMSHPPSSHIIPPYNFTNCGHSLVELNSIFKNGSTISKCSFVLQYVLIHTTVKNFISSFS